MPKTAAERMAATRARRRGELPAIKTCKICGSPLKPTSVGQAYEEGLCFAHWALTEAGKEYLKAKRTQRRKAQSGPTPFRYFGCTPGEEAWPEGPFNRIRLAVSSTYLGRNKARGVVFIVWSDDVVTRHEDVKQSDVGRITRESGAEVDRSDLTLMAKTYDALTERVRYYGHGDTYLV